MQKKNGIATVLSLTSEVHTCGKMVFIGLLYREPWIFVVIYNISHKRSIWLCYDLFRCSYAIVLSGFM